MKIKVLSSQTFPLILIGWYNTIIEKTSRNTNYNHSILDRHPTIVICLLVKNSGVTKSLQCILRNLIILTTDNNKNIFEECFILAS